MKHPKSHVRSQDVLQRLGSGHDRNRSVVLQCEQIIVTGNDKIGLGCKSAGKHGIIIRIGRNRFRKRIRFHNPCETSVQAQDFLGSRVTDFQDLRKLATPQDARELADEVPAGEKDDAFLLHRRRNQVMWRPVPQECGKYDVCVKYQSHSGARSDKPRFHARFPPSSFLESLPRLHDQLPTKNTLQRAFAWRHVTVAQGLRTSTNQLLSLVWRDYRGAQAPD